MNQFYASPDQINGNRIELTGQEASHVSKVLHKGTGEKIVVTDGIGSRYTGIIKKSDKRSVTIETEDKETFDRPNPEIALALGLIKKRDRLEFAVEKAVELGVSEILLFRGDHSEKFNVRSDRVEATVQSAMKQSLRVFLPAIMIVNSLPDLLSGEDHSTQIIHADQYGSDDSPVISKEMQRLLLVVGPEGGLSENEKAKLADRDAYRLKLGEYRLRAETAAMVMASRFGHQSEFRNEI
ncbi:16S rRNA (uracil(1498)-N(3))-methyltransferase [Rhodohalobacter sp. SW132]|uniref:RsmE family RNA methyltransferase n=1 Tax=Rhodohalobacter sp. SW132 TaxID=2293433 RepID=UPI000E26EC0B|nr:RsmE family RNA methyltransferase [Rhodohalobacter sp. SW132]REL24312.1 16S rRNA (uracil(1498)-N(3))-methyltransferase [Rhodohalobacter sp. SW132]